MKPGSNAIRYKILPEEIRMRIEHVLRTNPDLDIELVAQRFSVNKMTIYKVGREAGLVEARPTRKRAAG